MTNQTFYGVDIILYPEKKRGSQLHEQGKVIEMNGHKSGASFYKIGDMKFYSKIMQEFARNTKGRILLHHDPEWEFKKKESEEIVQAKKEYHMDQLERSKKLQKYLEENPLRNFYSVHDYSIEKLNWENEYYKDYKPNLDLFYLNAAKELGIDASAFIGINLFGGVVKYTVKTIDPEFLSKYPQPSLDKPVAELPYGVVPKCNFEQIYTALENIGLIWTSFTRGDINLAGRERLLNGYFEECILGDKALFYLYSSLLPEKKRTLDKFIPNTFLYGAGLHTRTEFNRWLGSCRSPFFVKKPLGESHGIGVEFTTREQMYKYDRSPFHDNSSSAIKEGYVKLLLDFIVGDSNLSRETVLFQEAVESAKILDQETGERFPACARAIVQNGKYQGAIWRSNKTNDGNLTERLRHNVTNGAEVMPVSDEDSKLLGEIAEASVKAFETTNQKILDRLSNVNVDYLDYYDGRNDVDQELWALQNSFYLGRIKRAAQHYGIDVDKCLSDWVDKIAINSQASETFRKLSSFNARL